MDKICPTCNKEFHVKPSHYGKRTYCSKDCMAEDYKTRLRGAANPNYKGVGYKICIRCETPFRDYGTQRYCSFKCYTNSDEKRIHAKTASDKALLAIQRKPKKHKPKLLRGICLNCSKISGTARNVKFCVECRRKGLHRKPPLSTSTCSKCGAEIPKRNRKWCDDCQPQKRKGKCLNCLKRVPSPYDVQFCKECRAKGLHKKEVFSICSACGTKIPNKYGRKYCEDCLTRFYSARRSTPRRIDQNQPEIIEALLKAGCSILDASPMGGGFPDLIAGKNGRNYLIEIKNPKTKGKLNEKQRQFFEIWQGQAAVAYTIEDALRIVGAID